MPGDLEPGVRELERPTSVTTARILRADEFLEHIEVRGLEPSTEAEPHILRELPDLGDDPPQDVASQDDRRGLVHARSFAAGAFGAGGHLDHALCAVWHLAPRHRVGRNREEGT